MSLHGGISGIGMKAPKITRDWTLAREKVELEGHCRNCGSTERLEAAHIVGREHDLSFPVRNEDWSPGDVAPDRILPLCNGCHQGPNGVHARRLDLLPLLTEPEQVQAVADCGSISQAYTLLMPSEAPRKVRHAA